MAKEGVGKLMVKRLLEDCTAAPNKRIYQAWNAAYQATSVFSETPRCSRKISTGKLKGSEMTVLIHGTFPHLIELMDQEAGDVW